MGKSARPNLSGATCGAESTDDSLVVGQQVGGSKGARPRTAFSFCKLELNGVTLRLRFPHSVAHVAQQGWQDTAQRNSCFIFMRGSFVFVVVFWGGDWATADKINDSKQS